MSAPDAAPDTAAPMLVNGALSLPSLGPTWAASTYTVAPSTGMSPQGAAPQPMISRHARSPGVAMSGDSQLSGNMASQPRSPSCSSPGPQPSGGTPAGTQPCSVPSSPAAQPFACMPAARQLPS